MDSFVEIVFCLDNNWLFLI